MSVRIRHYASWQLPISCRSFIELEADGGESGIRYLDVLLESVSYRFQVATRPIFAIRSTDHCTLLQAGTLLLKFSDLPIPPETEERRVFMLRMFAVKKRSASRAQGQLQTKGSLPGLFTGRKTAGPLPPSPRARGVL